MSFDVCPFCFLCWFSFAFLGFRSISFAFLLGSLVFDYFPSFSLVFGTILTSHESRHGEVLQEGGLIDGLAMLLPLRKSRQVLVRQADHV